MSLHPLLMPRPALHRQRQTPVRQKPSPKSSPLGSCRRPPGFGRCPCLSFSGTRRCPRAIPIFAAAGTPQILLLVFRPPKPREASCFWQSRDTSACRAAGGDSTVHSTALPGLQRRCGSRGHPSTTTARACHDAGGRVSSSSHTRHMRRQSGHFLCHASRDWGQCEVIMARVCEY